MVREHGNKLNRIACGIAGVGRQTQEMRRMGPGQEQVAKMTEYSLQHMTKESGLVSFECCGARGALSQASKKTVNKR